MTTPNIEELMKLADAYAAVTAGAVPDSDRYKIGLRTQEARAALHDALQSQAERIKTLEGQSIEVDKVLARENVSLRATLEQCESRLHDVATLCATVEIERDTLRAQLTAIAATEPVAEYICECPWGSLIQMQEDLPKQTKLFTRPMPAQDWKKEPDYLPALVKWARDIKPTQDASELPAISAEDQQWFTDNPNTSDIVEFIQDYARTALSKYKGAK